MTAPPKVAQMIDARRHDSATKRTRVLATVEKMLREGLPITFASVAREAKVSTWLVYAPGVRDAIEESRARQSDRAATARPPQREARGLATDLALARAEITRLRAERDEHQRQVRLALGSKLDDVAKADLLARLDELTRHNSEIVAEVARRRAENHVLKARVVELEDDLAAARTSLRRMIRAENLPAERS
jgi:BMFP domain-containing protein YqiC